MHITQNFIITLTLLLMINCDSKPTTLFTNLQIPDQPNIKAILCNDGQITNFLNNDNVIADKRIDLKGGWVYPGFIDAHMHLTGLGWAMESINLVGTTTKKEVLDKIKKAVSVTPEGTWIQGRGWDQNDWPTIQYPTKKDLDSISTKHPMAFNRIDGHATWANSLAINIAEINQDIPDISGGIIIRDQTGQLTGIFIDNAMDLILSKIPEPSEDDIYRYIIKAQSLLNQLGITSIHDAGTSKKEIEILKKMTSNHELSIRVYTMLNNNPDDYLSYIDKGPEIDNPFIKIRAIKIYLDGALGSRGAALIKPYSDAKDHSGLLLINNKEYEKIVKQFTSAGFQVNTHGIGDLAVRTILNTYEKVADKTLRNRIEHAQIVHKQDIHRFKELNVIPAMQATHCTSDMYWVDERLGDDRLYEAYPWQSIIQTGIPVPGGSDAPVEYPDPLAGIYAAITRQDSSGWPDGGWQKQERMTLEQAIKSYTEWAAYASFEENKKGALKKNYYADFTILNKELLSNNPLEILNTDVLFTIVNGKIVYQND